jgi:Lrp/AsnC family transcriptional regulator for asnA, asnC and gidA
MPKILAFVDIFVESPYMDQVIHSLQEIDNIKELYEVTGEFDIVTLVSAEDIEEFRDILKNRIMKIKGVKSTVSSIVLHAHKGPRCENGQTQQPSKSEKELKRNLLKP